jgi:hypothetical protein
MMDEMDDEFVIVMRDLCCVWVSVVLRGAAKNKADAPPPVDLQNPRATHPSSLHILL